MDNKVISIWTRLAAAGALIAALGVGPLAYANSIASTSQTAGATATYTATLITAAPGASWNYISFIKPSNLVVPYFAGNSQPSAVAHIDAYFNDDVTEVSGYLRSIGDEIRLDIADAIPQGTTITLILRDVTNPPAGSHSTTIRLHAGDGTLLDPGYTQIFAIEDPVPVVNGACGTADGAAFVAVPDTNLCAAGTASGVTANADTYTWSCTGSGGGTTASCSADLAYAIDVSAEVPAGGSASCTDNPVIHGDDATCTATSNAGYRFTGWSGDCGGTSASCMLGNVTAARSVTANFVAYTDPEAEYEDDSTTCYLPGCAQADLGGDEQEVEIDAPDTDTGNSVRIRVVSEPSALENGLRHELTVLDALGHSLHTTRADSELSGSSVVIDADADGRPRVTTRARVGSGADAADYEVQALADGSAIHKLTRADGTVTQMTSQAPGTQTLIDADGRIESTVEDGDPGSQSRAVVVTLPNGEGHTRYERYSDTLGDWETSADTADPISPFEAGHRSVVEAHGDGLRLRIVTPVTRDLYF